jgi:hypothetical protein
VRRPSRLAKRLPDAPERNGQLMDDEPGLKAQDAIAQPCERRIPSGISLSARRL